MAEISQVLGCCKLRLNSMEVLKQYFANQTRLDKGTRDCVVEILDAIQVNILKYVPLYCCQSLRLVVQQTYTPTPSFYDAAELHAVLKNIIQFMQSGLQVDVAKRLVLPFRHSVVRLLLVILLDSQARSRTISTMDYARVNREFGLIMGLLPCATQNALDSQTEKMLLTTIGMLKMSTDQLFHKIAGISAAELAEMKRPKSVLDMSESDILVRVLNLRRYCDDRAHRMLHTLKKSVQ